MRLTKANVGGVAATLAIIAALVFAVPKLVTAEEKKVAPVIELSDTSDAPMVKEVADEVVERSGLNPMNWPAIISERYNRPDTDAERIAELEAALTAAAGVQLHHDTLVETLQDQNKRDAEFFESLLAESERKAEALRLHNKSLDESMTALLDKDNSLMYVEGCYIARP